MEDVMKLFLTRVFAVALVLTSVTAVQAGFPFTPKQVGIPAFALAAWPRVGVTTTGGLVRSLLHFIIPAAMTMAILALAVYIYYSNRAKGDLLIETQRPTLDLTEPASATPTATALARDATTVLILCGLFLIVFAEPPTQFWTGGDVLAGDRRPALLALGMLAAYIVILASEPLRAFLGLYVLSFWDYVGLIALVCAWAFGLRTVWRARLLDRFLGVRLA